MKPFLSEILMVAVQHFFEDLLVSGDEYIVFGLQMEEDSLGEIMQCFQVCFSVIEACSLYEAGTDV